MKTIVGLALLLPATALHLSHPRLFRAAPLRAKQASSKANKVPPPPKKGFASVISETKVVATPRELLQRSERKFDAVKLAYSQDIEKRRSSAVVTTRAGDDDEEDEVSSR